MLKSIKKVDIMPDQDCLELIKHVFRHADKLTYLDFSGAALGEDLSQHLLEDLSAEEIRRLFKNAETLILGKDAHKPLHFKTFTRILLTAKKLKTLQLSWPMDGMAAYVRALEFNTVNNQKKGHLVRKCFLFPKLDKITLHADAETVKILLKYVPELSGKIAL